MFTISVYDVTDVLIDMQYYYLHILAEPYPVVGKSDKQMRTIGHYG